MVVYDGNNLVWFPCCNEHHTMEFINFMAQVLNGIGVY